MIRRPPRSTRTDTLFPYTTLFRSDEDVPITYLEMDTPAEGIALDNAASILPEIFRRAPIDFGKDGRSEEHTSELQSLMRISYAVFCLKKKSIDYNICSTTACV